MRFPPNGGRFGHHFGHHGGWGWLAGLVWLIVVAALIALVVVLVVTIAGRRWPLAAAPPGAAPPHADEAWTLLRNRYARGEVSREDYVRMAADLGHPVPPEEPSG